MIVEIFEFAAKMQQLSTAVKLNEQNAREYEQTSLGVENQCFSTVISQEVSLVYELITFVHIIFI